jgi:hypothetical protein
MECPLPCLITGGYLSNLCVAIPTGFAEPALNLSSNICQSSPVEKKHLRLLSPQHFQQFPQFNQQKPTNK